MRKAIIGVVLGAIVYFVAGALSWMVLPWMDHGLKKLPEETLIRDTMKVVVKESGAYIFPNHHTDNGPMEEKTFNELFKNGPAGLLFYQTPGPEPMSSKNFIVSGITAFAVSLFSMVFLFLVRGRVLTFGGRWFVVLFLGVFAWFITLMPLWNWMFVPTRFIACLLLDDIFAFGLLGLVLVKFIPPESH